MSDLALDDSFYKTISNFDKNFTETLVQLLTAISELNAETKLLHILYRSVYVVYIGLSTRVSVYRWGMFTLELPSRLWENPNYSFCNTLLLLITFAFQSKCEWHVIT